MSIIPDSHKDLLENPITATFTTVSPSNKPENTAVWFSWDGDYILVNSIEGRRKPDNIRKNPSVAVFVIDPTNNERWIDVRGVVEEIIPDEGDANIEAHSRRYTGKAFYGGYTMMARKGTETRIIFKIKPQRVVTLG